ncbi:Twin-arginine translocation protein TatC [Desulfosporosinus sp. I2]|uniref:twin-arginine translocase subunit TatC n=1 Tax=Desulfosporosinus sp. I2 TaxID=1617025 RepID=UPI0005EF5B86|nr:twin-arginine translocase subunit TatC [Desulfosporosinus sp. I2]KJR45357.1 Twin-arginine translocation protein TatC [Desulfosporosinus sp. I2]
MIINYVKIIDRLERVRKVLALSILALVVVTVVFYLKADVLVQLLTKPLGQRELVFLSPAEGFMAKIKVAFFSAFIVCLPLILWQSIRLVTPLLSLAQRRIIYWVIPVATLLFAAGVSFGYMVIIPMTLKFLLNTGQQYMVATLSAILYFSFVFMLVIVMGAVFELPLIMGVLASVGIISSKTLKEKRKVAFLAIVIVTAVLTPTPDAFTLVAASLPVLGLYELGILLIASYEKVSARKKQSFVQGV